MRMSRRSTLFGGGKRGPKIKYYGTATPFSVSVSDMASAFTDDYAFFGSGFSYTTTVVASDIVYAYDKDLTQSVLAALSSKRYKLAATSINNHVLFGGGFVAGTGKVDTVEAYDSNLTKKTLASLSVARDALGACSNKKYALFFCGESKKGRVGTVDAYDENFTRVTATNAYSLDNPKSTAIGDFVMIGGGGLGGSAAVIAYDDNLTRSSVGYMKYNRADNAAAAVGNFAVFGGGTCSEDASLSADAFDLDFTMHDTTPFTYPRATPAAINFGNCAMFVGGGSIYGDAASRIPEAYDEKLTKHFLEECPIMVTSNTAASKVGNFALFKSGANVLVYKSLD